MDQRYASRFMARDYVTIREQMRGGQTVWTFNTAKHDRLSRRRRRSRVEVVATRSWAPPGGLRSPRSRSRSTTDSGGRPSSTTDVAGTAARAIAAASRGGSGRLTGASPPLASTRSARERSRRWQRPACARRPRPGEQGHVLGEQRADRPPGGDPAELMSRDGDRSAIALIARAQPDERQLCGFAPGTVRRSPAGPAAGRLDAASLDGRGSPTTSP